MRLTVDGLYRFTVGLTFLDEHLGYVMPVWLFMFLHLCSYKCTEKLLCMTFFLCVSAAKPQPAAPSGSISKPDTGSPEKTPPRGEAKPEPVPRLRATSSSSSPGGTVSPKPPVPQGAKPALAARPTIPQKPRTTSSSRSIGIDQAMY